MLQCEMLNVINFNLNGLRSAIRKGFIECILAWDADIICLQELKADHDICNTYHDAFPGYIFLHHAAKKKGYSGTGILIKLKYSSTLKKKFFAEADQEGRMIMVYIQEYDLAIYSLYLPSGSSGDARQKFKMEFLITLEGIMDKIQNKYSNIIIAGDYNIVHTRNDIRYFNNNKNTSGCLPEERQWISNCLHKGWVDTFRTCESKNNQYTWWSMRQKSARENNSGWRIDYQLAYGPIAQQVQHAAIITTPFLSDHAPVLIKYNI